MCHYNSKTTFFWFIEFIARAQFVINHTLLWSLEEQFVRMSFVTDDKQETFSQLPSA